MRNQNCTEVNVKFTLLPARKAKRGSGSIAVLVLHPRRWKGVGG